MSLPSPEQFLARLHASPADAAEFDRCSPGLSRLEHVQAVLNAVRATVAETQSLKARLAASRAKNDAIAAVKKSQPASYMKTPPSPTKAPTAAPAAKLTSAEDFQKSIQPPSMRRSEFNKLTNAERNQWIRSGGKLV